MKLSHEMVKNECKRRGISIQSLLKAAGVSSNAYYSLAAKQSAIPKTISRIAETLAISPSAILFDEQAVLNQHLQRLAIVEKIASANPELDRDRV